MQAQPWKGEHHRNATTALFLPPGSQRLKQYILIDAAI
jgi:hypothetical protein